MNSKIIIEFINQDDLLDYEKIKEQILKVLEFILSEEEIKNPVNLTIEPISEDLIRKLNKEFRGIDQPTDVLSFPIYESIDEIKMFEPDYPILLGDVIINLNQVAVQAQEIGHSLEEEFIYLTIHSILHLLGYDHQNRFEKNQMRSKEKQALNYLKYCEEQ